ncbi:ester cyclase [Blastococcus haudaquaticus]|nr:ester cyclase [Blastococcus haudaquaticus]
MTGHRHEVVDRYGHYNAVCNRHAFGELAPFLADVVLVNGAERTAQQYIDDLFVVSRAFPDYRWEIQRTVFEHPWLAVHFRDTGTHLGTWRGVAATGRAVTTDEFSMYRFAGDRITEVWVTADNARLP